VNEPLQKALAWSSLAKGWFLEMITVPLEQARIETLRAEAQRLGVDRRRLLDPLSGQRTGGLLRAQARR
jgi:hypothetical protein